ncbi:30S ribosomal protein S16 [Myxococcota bacterium]|nr:30S ribosomal protein S16 [Myxococcota bacterium]
MAVKMKLARGGAKSKPFYRVVVADEKFRRDGRITEKVGYYNPIADPAVIELKMDRVEYWISQGVLPTDTVKRLIKSYKATVAGK